MTPIIGTDKFFKEAYVINLAARKDRYDQFDQMISQSNIGVVTRFDAIRNQADGPKGCADSHLAIVRIAKEKGLENVLIFEDDAMLVDNFDQLTIPVLEQLGQQKWDFFYFGGRLIAPATLVSPNLAKIIGVYCTHAYAINHTLYDKVLEYNHDVWKAIDVYYSMITRDFNSFIGYPITIHQRPSFSDLIGGDMDYRELFEWSYRDNIKI